ncbi:winged helix-turn-helix domain-containing protein [uncultured Methanobrevibacter sp.]|uniref:winged helix-turn-helix domain-containing protein n=1 Tax=uncultured Methanobrevibacter sp. TaxID=253161 RepID=UPI0025E31CD6|nr:winged helix-turn-helix domain-containing protein [uncultured Methanobrevibacter sp.]
MQSKNYNTIGFIRASQYRGEILKILSEDMKLPSEIAYDLKIRVSTVSNTLNDLKKYELIRCLNENAKKGRLYEITPYGEDILNYIDI